MTQNRRSKRAVRLRMARTGEKYTEARRALSVPGAIAGGGGDDPGGTITWPEDSLGWFTDQAYNAIRLADDEARMLSHTSVEPEHLLLAAARYGNVESLLAGAAIDARAIHDLLLRIEGPGDTLELRPRRSPASEEVLRRAVGAAAARGVRSPSTEHLLLALGEQELPARILSALGVASAQALVDSAYPVSSAPVDYATIERRAAQLAGRPSEAPSPGPIPPVFERFTSQARDAIAAGVEHARQLDDRCVEPAHLLVGVLTAEAGAVGAVRARFGWQLPPTQVAMPRYPVATGIFSSEARRIVAEDVLVVAERVGRRMITTGHVLIAILDRPDERCSEIISWLPHVPEITAAVIRALPGEGDN